MLELKELLSLNVFRELDDVALVDIAGHATVSSYRTNDRVCAWQADRYLYYLLQGEVELHLPGRDNITLNSDSGLAQNPLFYSAAEEQYATCRSGCRILRVKTSLIDRYAIRHSRNHNQLDVSGFDTIHAGTTGLSLMNEAVSLLGSKSVTLPAQPDTVLYINNELANQLNTSDLPKLAGIDPLIAARVIYVANKKQTGGMPGTISLRQAVLCVGEEGVKAIVHGVMLRDLFMPSSEIVNQLMKDCYRQSVCVAVICYELASCLSICNADRAYTAGLLHDIGTIPVLVVADRHRNLSNDSDYLPVILRQVKNYIGGVALQQWDFDSELIDVARYANDWRGGQEKSTLVDLVQLACYLFQQISSGSFEAVKLRELPASMRLGIQDNSCVLDNGLLEKVQAMYLRLTEIQG